MDGDSVISPSLVEVHIERRKIDIPLPRPPECKLNHFDTFFSRDADRANKSGHRNQHSCDDSAELAYDFGRDRVRPESRCLAIALNPGINSGGVPVQSLAVSFMTLPR